MNDGRAEDTSATSTEHRNHNFGPSNLLGVMSKRPTPAIADLCIPKAARFLSAPNGLTKTAVKTLFDDVLTESEGKSVAREVRVEHGMGSSRFVHSFLCFRTAPPVPFLSNALLKELRYGFVLLIERQGHVAVFHRAAKGLDDSIAKKTKPVDRRHLTHMWSNAARYQKLSTRRMTIAKHELRSASYEADDLETALVPAMASRSIVQAIRLATKQHGNVGITPSTGRVRVSASKASLANLVGFVDEALRGIGAHSDSAFLNAFPEPVDLDDLPANVEPAGMLFDTSELREALDDPTNPWTIRPDEGAPSADVMLETLSSVLTLRAVGDGWEGIDAQGNVFSKVKRLTHSYSVMPTIAREYTVEDQQGVGERMDRWLRQHAAFSLSFTSPEYFYSDEKLFRRAGFEKEVELVTRYLTAHATLDAASSEKGGPYRPVARHFAARSIFGILEKSLAVADKRLWCCDLGDEWADYIGISAQDITFYHCKHGSPTTGASDFQIVVGQALKNLARVKFRHDEVQQKVRHAQERNRWGETQIALLRRSPGGWPALEQDLSRTVSDPNTRWRVALVVTSLSLAGFTAAAALPTPSPHFIQQVWLLSAFLSACRERDAQPLIYCRT